jgi:hypothetical protein
LRIRRSERTDAAPASKPLESKATGHKKQTMRRLLSNRWIRWIRWIRWSAILLLLLLTTVLGLAWYTRTWTSADLLSLEGMRRECHPVWSDLFWRRIGPGQDVEEVIAATKPLEIRRYGDFVLLEYQRGLCCTGVYILARQGKLINAEAGSCCWRRTFFDLRIAQDHADFETAYEAHWRPIFEKQDAEEKANP